MNKLKEFINKKKTDKAFKKAGHGQTLNSSSTGTSGFSGSRQPTYVLPKDTADRRALSQTLADVTTRRLNKPEQPMISAGQRRIQEQAMRECMADQRCYNQLDPGTVDPNILAYKRDGVHVFEHSEQISTVLYTCDLLEEQKPMPKNELFAQIEKLLVETLSTEPVEASTLMIWSLNKGSVIEQGIPILLKYVTNILNAPTDPKFRRIKTSNKVFMEKVAPLKGGSEFLKAIGFIEDEQKNSDGDVDTFLALPEPDEETLQMLEMGVSALEAGSAVSIKLHRDPQFYRIDSEKPIPQPKIPADFFLRTADELKKEQMLRAEAVDKLTTLRTSKTRKEEAHLRQYTYKYTLIRIRFPNNFVLQGVFNVQEKFKAVHEFLSEMIGEQVGEYVITDPTASDVRFNDYELTLNDYGLVPTALLHFEWDNDTLNQLYNLKQRPSYLRSELEQKALPL